MFGCRRAAPGPSCSVAAVAAEEVQRQRQVAGPTVELQLDVASDLPAVAINDAQLRTVLAQLLDNAREALPGRGVIRLSATSALLDDALCGDMLGDPTPGPCVEVTVADNGCGIASDVRRHLFQQPFLSSKPRHRGLGLAVVYGILHAHQGGIRLEDAGTPEATPRTPMREAGVQSTGGAIVRLYLPLAGVPVARAFEGPAATGGECVLVVDDDPAILLLVSTTLESAGYQVQSFSCPVQALESCAQGKVEPFQLVLSDVIMPQMNGFDMARRLLDHDARARVMFMSGYTSPEMAQAHGLFRHYDLLYKPFRPEALLRAVRSALARDPSADGGVREDNVVSFS
jgi:CheY-like chemotaxis protein